MCDASMLAVGGAVSEQSSVGGVTCEDRRGRTGVRGGRCRTLELVEGHSRNNKNSRLKINGVHKLKKKKEHRGICQVEQPSERDIDDIAEAWVSTWSAQTSLLTEFFVQDCQSLPPPLSNCYNEEQREVCRVKQPPERGINDTAGAWPLTEVYFVANNAAGLHGRTLFSTVSVGSQRCCDFSPNNGSEATAQSLMLLSREKKWRKKTLQNGKSSLLYGGDRPCLGSGIANLFPLLLPTLWGMKDTINSLGPHL
nr:hypothetical protein Iba_chr11dCG10160 [Ipomoea batatas]